MKTLNIDIDNLEDHSTESVLVLAEIAARSVRHLILNDEPPDIEINIVVSGKALGHVAYKDG